MMDLDVRVERVDVGDGGTSDQILCERLWRWARMRPAALHHCPQTCEALSGEQYEDC